MKKVFGWSILVSPFLLYLYAIGLRAGWGFLFTILWTTAALLIAVRLALYLISNR
jgi:hypothetical protein